MGETSVRGSAPRARVLLADDDGAVRSFFQIVLMQQRCAVSVAKDGDEAVALLKTEKFDIIFTDYLMPGRDGVDVLAIALQTQPHARRVLMSASLIDRELRDLAAEIADEILVKPVPIATVALLIDRFTGVDSTKGHSTPC